MTIPRLDSPISVNVTDIYVGDTAYINVTAPTGDVTIEINGITYNPTTFDNGIARFVVQNLTLRQQDSRCNIRRQLKLH